MTNFRHAERRVIYKANVGYNQLEAPKIQSVNGELYCHFAMRNETVSQRLYVMKAVDPTNPMGRCNAPIRLLENIWSLTSIHGTVLTHNDVLYLVWTSQHPVAESRAIYIAPMSSPTNVMEPIVPLRQPTEAWECQGYCSNEAPSFIYNIGASYMMFSASVSSHPDHCLSYMSIESGKDPLNNSNWKSAVGPVFAKNEEGGVYATGHSSFTTSPDGAEIWMVYHGSESSTGISGNLLARIDKVAWDFDPGTPSFPIAHGSSNPQPRPSGEPEMFTNPILDERSHDPSIIKLDGFYYLVLNNENSTELVIFKSSTPTDFRNTERKTIYVAPEGYSSICCGKIYSLDGLLYIYFTMNGPPGRSANVISANVPDEPMGSWSGAKRLMENAFDGSIDHCTVLNINDRSYFTWSGQSHINNSWAIYLAQMQNPGEIVLPVVLLRQPSEPWECLDRCWNESPTFAYNDNVAYMIFAAHNGQYPSLSYMSIESGRNPLDVSNWVAAPGPMFTNNADESVYIPDPNCAIMTDPEGGETWLLYNGRENATSGYLTSRMERIEWDADGSLVFPRPHGRSNPQPVPKA